MKKHQFDAFYNDYLSFVLILDIEYSRYLLL